MTKPDTKKVRNSRIAFCNSAGAARVDAYVDRLDRDPEWAMGEGSSFFEGKGQVQATLHKITKKLNELGIEYAVVGGMAMFKHGYRRFTDYVDILVTKGDLKRIHQELDGLGYLPPVQGSKNLQDTDNGVKIEFLLTGDYPGDGKVKPVAFPAPGDVNTEMDGIRYINLQTLIELKVASGMTNSERLKDLADVIELIKALSLPRTLVEKLNPFVQEKYAELWKDSHPRAKRYITLWRNKWLTSEAKSLQDMVDGLQSAVDQLRAMLADGVTLEPGGGSSDDYARLVTTDLTIALKYDMHDETEFWVSEDLEEEDDIQESSPR